MNISKLSFVVKSGKIVAVEKPQVTEGVRELAIVYFHFVGDDNNESSAISTNANVSLFLSKTAGGARSHAILDLSLAEYPEEVKSYDDKVKFAAALLNGQQAMFTKASFRIEDYFADDAEHAGCTEVYDAKGTAIHAVSRCYVGTYNDKESAFAALERHLTNRLTNGVYTFNKPQQSTQQVQVAQLT